MIGHRVFRIGSVMSGSFLLAVLVSMLAHGATYYVAPNGSDANPGTEAPLWRTIQKAADTLIAGDMVFVKEGSYNERVIPHNSGNPGNYATYIAYPGDTVTIDGIGISMPGEFDWGGLFDVSGRSYIKISGFRIINSLSPHGSEEIYLKEGMRQDHIVIENNYFHNISGPAVGAYSCDNLIIIHTLIYLFPQIFLESQLC